MLRAAPIFDESAATAREQCQSYRWIDRAWRRLRFESTGPVLLVAARSFWGSSSSRSNIARDRFAGSGDTHRHDREGRALGDGRHRFASGALLRYQPGILDEPAGHARSNKNSNRKRRSDRARCSTASCLNPEASGRDQQNWTGTFEQLQWVRFVIRKLSARQSACGISPRLLRTAGIWRSQF